MNEAELGVLLSSVKGFKHTYASNELEDIKIRVNGGLIFNTSPRWETTQGHWAVLYKLDENCMILVDSLHQSTLYPAPYLKQFLRNNNSSYMKTLTFPIQSYSSQLCLSLIHISEPTRLLSISYAVFC